jgi:hypothetical protein
MGWGSIGMGSIGMGWEWYYAIIYYHAAGDVCVGIRDTCDETM